MEDILIIVNLILITKNRYNQQKCHIYIKFMKKTKEI